MKKIIGWETEDGKVFQNKRDAQKWENELTFDKHYEDNKIYCSYDGSHISCVEIKEWIRGNAAAVLILLNQTQTEQKILTKG